MDERFTAVFRSDLEKWMTTKQAAEILGRNITFVRALVASGELEARKFGRRLAIGEKALQKWIYLQAVRRPQRLKPSLERAIRIEIDGPQPPEVEMPPATEP